MKKISIVTLLCILFIACGGRELVYSTVSADSSVVSVIVNGKSLDTSSSAYRSGSTVMIPLREVAIALKYKVSYEKSTDTITISGVKEKIVYKLGSGNITINDTEQRSFKEEVVVNKERLFVPLSFFTSLGLVTGYERDADHVAIYAPEVTASVIAGMLTTGQFSELENRFFTDDLKRSLSVAGFQQYWTTFTERAGNYHGIKSAKSSYTADQFLITCVLGFAETEASLEIVLNKSGKITALKEKLPPM